MNRRDLIKAFAAAVPLTVAGRVWAAPATDAKLLVVFLRGAYDAANAADLLLESIRSAGRIIHNLSRVHIRQHVMRVE